MTIEYIMSVFIKFNWKSCMLNTLTFPLSNVKRNIIMTIMW